jgi:hypothetical protein
MFSIKVTVWNLINHIYQKHLTKIIHNIKTLALEHLFEWRAFFGGLGLLGGFFLQQEQHLPLFFFLEGSLLLLGFCSFLLGFWFIGGTFFFGGGGGVRGGGGFGFATFWPAFFLFLSSTGFFALSGLADVWAGIIALNQLNGLNVKLPLVANLLIFLFLRFIRFITPSVLLSFSRFVLYSDVHNKDIQP